MNQPSEPKGFEYQLIRWFVTGSYAGLLPFSPGTFGTVMGIPLVLLWAKMPVIVSLVCTILLIIVGVYASDYYQAVRGGEHDRQEIVIDEICGLLITMTLVPIIWQTVLAGFLLFRFFDILKPWPISYLDQKVKGGIGVMIDDVAAGIAASLVLQILIQKTDWLGVQVF